MAARCAGVAAVPVSTTRSPATWTSTPSSRVGGEGVLDVVDQVLRGLGHGPALPAPRGRKTRRPDSARDDQAPASFVVVGGEEPGQVLDHPVERLGGEQDRL